MSKHTIFIDRASPESLQMQIRRQIAMGIVDREYPLHRPLPSIRRLAAQLGVSVSTVTLAYEALKADGFVEARGRMGYFVNREALLGRSHDSAENGPQEPVPAPRGVDYRKLFRGRSFDRERVLKPADALVRYRFPFVAGLSDPSLFPLHRWRECLRDSANVAELVNWAADYSTLDDEHLVEQLMRRVLARRGIVARPDEVLITVGSQNALYIAVKLLLSPGETLGVEDPGYPDVINIADIEGIRVRRLPVDGNGLILGGDIGRCKCLYVTPSHQFPTTVTMPFDRKVELLELTGKNGQFVIEDDYEADVSFEREPPPALRSLDVRGNVIYAGSLTKSLLPGLRIGYLVAHPDLIREARALRHHILRHPSVNNQRSVAMFIERGYFDHYVNKIARVYRERCAVMYRALVHRFPYPPARPRYGGTSIWVRLPEDVDGRVLQDLVGPRGVYFETGGETFSDREENSHYIRLGYSTIDKSLIPEGIRIIANALPEAAGR